MLSSQICDGKTVILFLYIKEDTMHIAHCTCGQDLVWFTFIQGWTATVLFVSVFKIDRYRYYLLDKRVDRLSLTFPCKMQKL